MSTQQEEYVESQKLMALREGCRTDVYLDTLGKLTVGIGHLVVASDNLMFRDLISDEQVTAFFQKDDASAMSAAREQAEEAGITDSAFMPYLA